MAYTAAQYAAQDRVMRMARWSRQTGLCPVCQWMPLAYWPDGVQRATCGHPICAERWLNIRPASAAGTPPDALSAAMSHQRSAPRPPGSDGFAVSLVMEEERE